MVVLHFPTTLINFSSRFNYWKIEQQIDYLDVHAVEYSVLLSYPDFENPNYLWIKDADGKVLYQSEGVSPAIIIAEQNNPGEFKSVIILMPFFPEFLVGSLILRAAVCFLISHSLFAVYSFISTMDRRFCAGIIDFYFLFFIFLQFADPHRRRQF